jgi:hypothetical protein
VIPGRVMVGFLHPGEYAACFANSLIQLLLYDAFHEQRMAHAAGYVGNETAATQIVTGRNQIARSFLDGSDAEWLFMIDADMGFAPDTVERLIATATKLGVPVVGGLAFACKSDGNGPFGARRYRATPTLYRFYADEDKGEAGVVPMFDYPRNQPVEVEATGAAILLVHRTVLEQLRGEYGDHWFDLIELPAKVGQTTLGEDISFCLRLKAQGIPLIVDTAVQTTHDKGWFLDEEYYDLQQAVHASRPVAAPLIDVVIPTFGRADRLTDVAFNVIENTANLASVTFVVEADDAESIEAVQAIPSSLVRCLLNTGPRSYAGAINIAAGYRDAPWLFTGADDLRFHPGWDESALRLATATGAQVVGTNDLGHPAVLRGEHSTHSLVHRDYIADGATAERILGKVLHEYDHCYVDTELVAVARFRRVYAHCHAAKVEHLHPIWDKGSWDETYAAGAANVDADKVEFDKRMKAVQP